MHSDEVPAQRGIVDESAAAAAIAGGSDALKELIARHHAEVLDAGEDTDKALTALLAYLVERPDDPRWLPALVVAVDRLEIHGCLTAASPEQTAAPRES